MSDRQIQLLTIRDVANYLQVSIKTVRRMITSGALPVIRFGRIVRVHSNDLEQYVASRRSL